LIAQGRLNEALAALEAEPSSQTNCAMGAQTSVPSSA
jgi:hypothetical protein